MDALDVLMHDHRMVEQLFRDYQASASERQRRGVVELLVRELSKHAALEEMFLYPLARKVLPDGDREVDEHLRVLAAGEAAIAVDDDGRRLLGPFEKGG